MTKATYHLEIGPLKEGNYTGIAQVTAAIAEQMLDDATRQTQFFFGRALVDRAVIEDLLARRNGELIEWYLQRAKFEAAPACLAGPQVAIFPNRKTCRRGFDIECQIIHDLSTLLTPQFHNADTVEYHALTMLDDVRSNDLTFCVSEATRQDVLRYLGPLPEDRVVTARLAAASHRDGEGQFKGRRIEPYILVLGTIEPRKNVAQVLDYLRRNREILGRFRFVFLGRHGWGDTIDTLLRQHDLLRDHDANRILFPGFVSEPCKNALVEHAQLLIYPSLFEGFGLPVIEALSLGTPCITTRSSSIPEAGGEQCYYFDPFRDQDFDRTLTRALLDLRMRGEALRGERRAWAAQFSWKQTYDRMMGAIDRLLAEPNPRHAW